MSFDHLRSELLDMLEDVSIPFEQGDVFRPKRKTKDEQYPLGLNPFRAGRCLSTYMVSLIEEERKSLNPFRAGRCLSTSRKKQGITLFFFCLNPFRAGRCLSTLQVRNRLMFAIVSIPFEQGDVFRLEEVLALTI